MTAHLNIEQRALARRLRSEKMSLRDIAKQIGCSSAGIDVMLSGQVREARRVEWIPRLGALTIEEREEILRGLSRGDSLSEVGRQLGRHTSSVSREVKANGGRDDYRTRARAPARAAVCEATQDEQTKLRATREASDRGPRKTLVARGDCSSSQVRVPRRDPHATQPRDHLPVPLRAGKRRTSKGTGPMLALRPHHAPVPRASEEIRSRRQHDQYLAATRRGRGPLRAGSLGR